MKEMVILRKRLVKFHNGKRPRRGVVKDNRRGMVLIVGEEAYYPFPMMSRVFHSLPNRRIEDDQRVVHHMGED